MVQVFEPTVILLPEVSKCSSLLSRFSLACPIGDKLVFAFENIMAVCLGLVGPFVIASIHALSFLVDHTLTNPVAE